MFRFVFDRGTPTSTTTSLSAISNVAIKDGHRGHGLQAHRGHAHQSSTNSLDAERADRISRLAGLERVSTLRASALQAHSLSNPISTSSANTTPASAGLYPPSSLQALHGQAQALNPPNVFFDANGQPTMHTKMSTVGTASATSATASVSGRTFTAGSDDGETLPSRDEDMLSTDTNIQSIGNDSEAMDPEEIRSRGGFDDRMSDDGSASLVGFGEGANSTVSGPIYQRRPLPPAANNINTWSLERSSSGLSEGAMLARRDRERLERDREQLSYNGASSDIPTSNSITTLSVVSHTATVSPLRDPDGALASDLPDGEGYYETANSETIRPHRGGRHTHFHPSSNNWDVAERIIRERLDHGGDTRPNDPTMTSPGPSHPLGQFWFEKK